MEPKEIYHHIKAGMSEARAVEEINALIEKKAPSITYDELNSFNKVAAREAAFKVEVFSFAGKYPLDMLQEFFDYWSEKTRNKLKMRYESEKTWDIDKRIRRWSGNNFKSFKNAPVAAPSKGRTFL